MSRSFWRSMKFHREAAKTFSCYLVLLILKHFGSKSINLGGSCLFLSCSKYLVESNILNSRLLKTTASWKPQMMKKKIQICTNPEILILIIFSSTENQWRTTKDNCQKRIKSRVTMWSSRNPTASNHLAQRQQDFDTQWVLYKPWKV